MGWLTAEYGMLPRSTGSRMDREAARGKQSGRTVEIQRLIGRSLRAALDLRLLGERTLTIGGFSKTFSITGWRIGYLAGPADLVDAIGLVQDQMLVCAPRPLQRGVQRALAELPASFYTDLSRDYEGRRDRFCSALEDAGFEVTRPQGAYYAMAGYGAVLGDREPYDAVMSLIERTRINAVPGNLFHADGSGVRTIRFHFAVADEVLDECCRRLRELAS